MPFNCFSCFKPPAPDDDTNPGPRREASPATPRAAGPSTLTAASSIPHAAPSSSTAGPSTSRGPERRRVDSIFSLRYDSLGENASGKEVFAMDLKNSNLNITYADEGSSYQPQNTLDLPSFSLEQLRRATNDFTSECLGEGTLGKVYKGHLDEEKQDVAIKLFNLQTKKQLGQFVFEVEVLRNVHHPNLLKLFGFCAEKEDRLLVYEYMALGSLDTHLFDLPPGRQPLDWNTRIQIAIDIASGLGYLHETMKDCILHGDLKSSNILLGEGYHAKLSDFGLATVAPKVDEIRVSTRTSGSMAYIAPEFHPSGFLTRKTDIYSFGIVLLELITGKVAYDTTRPDGQQKLNEWVEPVYKSKDRERYPEVADPLLAGQYSIASLERALCIALWCANEDYRRRPKIAQVMKYLNKVIPHEEPSSNPASPRD